MYACLTCGNAMRTIRSNGVSVEKCSFCGAMLFDNGELQRYIEAILHRNGIYVDVPRPQNIDYAIAWAFAVGSNGCVVGESPDCCPEHGVPFLLVRQEGGEDNTEVDVCPEGGCVWFDGGLREEGTIPEIVAYVQAALDQYPISYQVVTVDTYWHRHHDDIFWW